MKSACVLPGGVERTEIRKEFRDRLREQSLEPAPFASITGVLHFMIYAFVERRVSTPGAHITPPPPPWKS